VKNRWSFLATILFVWSLFECFSVDAQEKLLITHSSESISITPLIYGIEKGFYRREGIELQFRVLRGELAVSSIVSGKDVDYMSAARGCSPDRIYAAKGSPWLRWAAPEPLRRGLRCARSAWIRKRT
jgi:hypothetical protein